MKKQSFNISDYQYDLPQERIAKFPLIERDGSKLLLYQKNQIKHYSFANLPKLLPDNSLLVFNNTKVIYARLLFQKVTGARIEIFCLSPIDPIEYQSNLSGTSSCTWKCMVGNLKKWKDEELKLIISESDNITLKAKKKSVADNKVMVEFSWTGNYTFAHILHEAGKIPIPPYLQRESEDIDKSRYQTVYSKLEGSVAAPTAGLHFTERVFNKLEEAGHQKLELTLHVGAGTFVPVKTEDFREHAMHEERFSVDLNFLKKLINHKGPVIPVGTTSLRTLESIYWLGVKSFDEKDISILSQWEYQYLAQNIPRDEALESLINEMQRKNMQSLTANTGIMITPGYRFRLANCLITNFHQPGSTLLLLIAAFIGQDWNKVYDYALKNDFRFLSYGDSSLLFGLSV